MTSFRSRLIAVPLVALAMSVPASFLLKAFMLSPLFAQTSALGPITTTVTAGTGATLAALPANPTRRAVTICNGSATATVTITTGAVTPVSLTTGQVLQTGNVVASCFTISQIGSVGGNVGAAINVIASAASTPVTFFEYP